MAPWPERGAPSRLASPVPPPMPPPPQLPPPPPPQSQHLSTPRHVRAGSAAERYRSTSRVSEVDVWDTMQNHQIQVDSSSSDEGLHPRSRPRPRHTRSVSHPFPSLFSSKKKRSSPKVAADDESTSESAGERPSLGAKPSSPMRGHRNGSSAGSRDFATGRCMTCGSLLRWPRDLLVFKCTICVTINDLQPVDRLDRPGNAPDAAGVAEERATSKDKAISLTYTKSLAERCLRSFLASVLKRPTSDGLPIEKAPPVAYSHPPRIQTSPSAPSATTPLTLRPRISPTSEPWLAPGRHRGAAQHRRAPSWAGTTTTTPHFAASPERRPRHLDVSPHPLGRPPDYPPSLSPQVEPKQIFRPLEDYIVACFTSFHCLNSSFLTPRGHPPARHGAETRPRRPSELGEPRREPRREPQPASYLVPDLDPKLLLLGDVAENGSWWAGWEEAAPAKTASNRSQNGPLTVSSRSPHIDWAALEEWYSTAIEAGRPWSDMYDSLIAEDPGLAASPSVLQDIEAQILIGQEHVQRALLKACETILKRPGRRITEPQELRFLLLIAANPLLHASYKPYAGRFPHPHSALPTPNGISPQSSGPASGRHSAIIKRIVGLLSNAPSDCHNHLVAWFARYPESRFVQTKDLVAGFLAYRLIRQNEKKYEARIDYMAGLVPSMADGQSSASLHAALGHTQRSSKKQQQEKKPVVYQEDWQIKAAAQVLGFLFAANNMGHARRGLTNRPNAASNKNRDFVRAPGQILATSDFYMTLLDESDLVADFETWERGQGRFSFCQHPFLLSIGAKIRILEHDARRQMEHKARDAFFDSIMTNRAVQQFLVLNIRRECLVEDSLKAVSEVIGSGGEEIKKGLKINFQGEEGVDAGGLRKEWFLLLVREVFNPDHGMFLYDEDSHYCYFNPNSLEPSEQFFLVGVVLGLAIYNSTILDIALPPFAFRKLLLAAPAPSTPSPQPRQQMTYTLDDLAEYRPRLAHGLRQLLAFEGDVESTFALDFAIDTERYGVVERVALCPGGENRPVTNANRREYVDAYVRHALDTSVARQFEPFKRGFFTVCGGGALSLFRPEEIDLLVRGSSGYADQPLDVDALRAGAQYDGWDCNSNHSNNNNNSSSSNGGSNSSSSSASGGGGGSSNANQSRADRAAPRDPAEDEPTVRWFWDALARAPPPAQRRLLAFVTGSDRVPAMGAASLRVRLVCLGDDCGRFPTARTCFNSLGLWRCKDRERFEAMLWRAVEESEGFGLK